MITPRTRPIMIATSLALLLGACSAGADDDAASDEDLSAITEQLDELSGIEDRLARVEAAVADGDDGEGVDDVTRTGATASDDAASEPAAEESEPAEESGPAAAPHWTYADAARWDELAAEFSTCGSGTEQSPIDLTRPVVASIANPELRYQRSPATVTDNGHTVQVDVTDGGSVVVDGRAYELAQFHFHAPAEHTIDGQQAPAEVHFVHADADGRLAVIGVMVAEGKANRAFAEVLDRIPASGEQAKLPGGIDAAELLPPHLAAYRYAGSLTTPPCTEGVAWTVVQQPIQWSEKQIATLGSHLAEPNNRPVQPQNERDLRVDITSG